MRTAMFAGIVALGLSGTAQAQLVLSVPAEANDPSPAPAPAPEAAQVQAHSEPDSPALPQEQAPPPKIQDQAQTKIAPEVPPAPPVAATRYRFDKVNGGFVRLDSTTGNVAYCSARTVGWTCQSVAEDRAALEQEIARLQGEVAALRSEIDALRAAPPPPVPPALIPPPAAAPPDKNGDITIRLPTQDEITRARTYLEDTLQSTWNRLVEMISNFQKDVMRKG